QVEGRLTVARIPVDRLPELDDRFRRDAPPESRDAEVTICNTITWLDPDGASEVLLGLGDPTRMCMERATSNQDQGRLGLDLEGGGKGGEGSVGIAAFLEQAGQLDPRLDVGRGVGAVL